MDPTARSFRIVRVNATDPDPALDPERMKEVVEAATGGTRSRYAEYVFTRDEKHLVFRESGPKPVWFHIKRLPAAWMCDTLDALFGASAQRLLAFRAACHEVTGDDPIRVEVHGDKNARFVAGPANGGVCLAPAEWVEEIAERFGLETIQEVGRAAIDFSRLPRGSRGPFVYWGGGTATP